MRSIVEVVQNLIKPYIDSVKQALANEAVTRSKVGAHNLLPNDAVSSVFHGLTFTVNANGSISVSGQKDDASSHAYEICALLTLQAGTYTLSDGITDGTDNIDVAIYTSNGQTRLAWTRGTSHKETFTIASDTSCMAQINFRGATSTQFSYTVYPMLCLATDENTDYEPYAMTNRELTNTVLKYKDITATTNSDGCIENYSLGDAIPAFVICTSRNLCYVVIATYNGAPGIFYVKNASDNSAVANTSVTLRIYYH